MLATMHKKVWSLHPLVVDTHHFFIKQCGKWCTKIVLDTSRATGRGCKYTIIAACIKSVRVVEIFWIKKGKEINKPDLLIRNTI